MACTATETTKRTRVVYHYQISTTRNKKMGAIPVLGINTPYTYNMTIQTFIEKAIEGGWKDPFVQSEHFRHDILYGISYPVYAMLLDPLAWQAVGKVEGKENQYERFTIWRDTLDGEVKTLWWTAQMHMMIDALAEGKSIEEFLTTL